MNSLSHQSPRARRRLLARRLPLGREECLAARRMPHDYKHLTNKFTDSWQNEQNQEVSYFFLTKKQYPIFEKTQQAPAAIHDDNQLTKRRTTSAARAATPREPWIQQQRMGHHRVLRRLRRVCCRSTRAGPDPFEAAEQPKR